MNDQGAHFAPPHASCCWFFRHYRAYSGVFQINPADWCDLRELEETV